MFKFLELFAETLECRFYLLILFVDSYYFFFPLFSHIFILGLKVGLDQGATYVGIVLEIEKRLWVHRHKAFEELLV